MVDDDPDPRLLRLVTSWDVAARAANPRRSATLEAAGIQHATALMCTSADDLDNLEIALLARRLRADLRVVVQLGNAAVGRAVATVTGPGSVLDVASLAAPTLAEACLDLRSRSLDIGGEPFVLQELDVTGEGTLRALFGDLVPIAVIRAADDTMHVCPGRDLEVGAGDRVVLLGTGGDFADRRMPLTEKAAPARRRLEVGRRSGATAADSSPKPTAPSGSPCSPWSASLCCRSGCCTSATATAPDGT